MVVYHVAVSLDGRTAGFDVDLALFYGLAGTWNEDVTLTGADTLLAAEPALAAEADMGPGRRGVAETQAQEAGAAAKPLLAVVDGRGRVRDWQLLRSWPYWRDAIALCCRATPARHLQSLRGLGVETIVAGVDRVDLSMALETLAARHGSRLVRVDSGGALAGALLAAGLVDELSLVVHPIVIGPEPVGRERREPQAWAGAAAEATSARRLRLRSLQHLEGDVVWLRYDVPAEADKGGLTVSR
jgi:2,5-diamino-6-(ribosylamino)-4(3H)-pyrimidinone 5'-phosphate reductase